jgi:flagellar hook assembly protein FlgD
VISFEIPSPGAQVNLRVFDVTGRLVRTLVNERRAAGYYWEPWDLTNDGGRTVAPGVYFCRMEAGNFRDTKKLVLLR